MCDISNLYKNTGLFWRRKQQPTPVFLLGKSHVQRSLADYSPWGRRVRHDLATKQLDCSVNGCKAIETFRKN